VVTIDDQLFSHQQDGTVTTQNEVVTMVATNAAAEELDSIRTPQRHTSVAKIEASV
jgi:hypothetical protein